MDNLSVFFDGCVRRRASASAGTPSRSRNDVPGTDLATPVVRKVRHDVGDKCAAEGVCL
jgi:hypothetical protein